MNVICGDLSKGFFLQVIRNPEELGTQYRLEFDVSFENDETCSLTDPFYRSLLARGGVI